MRLVAWAVLLAFVPLAARADDLVPPAIFAQPAATPAPGEPVQISCEIVDESPIFEPAVFWRIAGERAFRSQRLLHENTVFQARITVPSGARTFEYYLEAFDAEGNGPARFGSPEQPVRVELPAAPASVPAPSPVVEEPEKKLSPLVWVIAGAALLVVATGVALGVTAHSSP